MKNLFFLITAFLFTTATFAQQATDSAQDPTALGNAFFKALLSEDANTIEKLVAPDFSLISFDGNAVEGATLVQGVGGGYVVIETGTVSNSQTRQYNNDTAIMTGIYKAKGTTQGQSFDSSLSFSLVSVRQGGSWKIASLQFTPVH